MSLFTNGKQIVGSGASPRIGKNGNWQIGDRDTGIPSSSDIHYTTSDKFASQSNEGIYFVYEKPSTVTIYHVDENGKKRIVTDKSVIVPSRGSNGNWFIGTTDTGVPVSGDGSTIAGVAINDNGTDGSTTWSSAKIVKEIDRIINETEGGKPLEFRWEGTRLGVRVEGDDNYVYSELRGRKGDTGIDGASLVGARLNEQGDLILEVPDNEENQDLSKILSFEQGVITLNDMRQITNSITMLKRQVDELTERVEELTNSSNNG